MLSVGEPREEAFLLPPLRSDLRLDRGAPDEDGSPMWTLFDPLRHQYFHLHLQGLRLIRHWRAGTSAEDMAEEVSRHGADVDADEVIGMARFMVANSLTVARSPADTQRLQSQHERTRIRWWQWLLHRYLFFRIPLVHPDDFLVRTLPWARPLAGRTARWMLLIIGLVGLWLVARQWEHFAGTFLRFLSWEGALWYGLALMSVKSAHELGHAYVAKHYGCRVPSMGVAFLVMFPMLYTDATDTWRLSNDRHRLRVSLAGVLTEMAIAVLATFAWGLLPDGALRQACFFLATTSWITSLLVNLSPFMRFDGYHALSDFWGIRNLQPRAFALTRWRMREALFAFGEPPPESFRPRRRRLLIAYSTGTWIYRFFLFLGIALLVYHFAFKALGIFLFAVEIGWFIVRPITQEIAAMLGHKWRFNRNVLRTALIAIVLLAALLVPWRGTIGLPAVIEASEHVSMHPPEAARITHVGVVEGQRVAKGDMLVELEKPELLLESKKAEATIKVILARLARRAGSAEDLASEGVLRTQLAESRTRLTGLTQRRDALRIVSPIDGLVVQRADMQAGQWVGTQEELADVVSQHGARVFAYVREQNLARIEKGAQARFIPNDGSHPSVDLRVVSVEDVGTERLPYPVLASTYGGPLPVMAAADGEAPRLDEGVYRVVLETVDDAPAPALRLPGHASVQAPPESIAGRFVRNAASVLIRESGF
ncbi:HlyD family efflux transporter periplasmic adaptor subunit [Salinisphaera aquimarina]|uniref:HlyD family efflux transporter periplasmic adaptor subunit n=1 Tax=Salinisphaera aquimarina TaxID=2094031 RepID=A0ABV7ELR9_9GAMM